MKSLVVLSDARRIAGICFAAKNIGTAIAAVMGNRDLAEQAVAAGFDRVVLFEVPQGVPAEALCADVVAFAKEEVPDLIMSSDAAAARMACGAISGALDTPVIGEAIRFAESDGRIAVTRNIAGGIAVEDVLAVAPLVAVFAGEDMDPISGGASIEVRSSEPSSARIVGIVPPDEGAINLSDASRIIGIGRGVRARADLPMVEALADKLGAIVACTLPICDDLHWYGADRVLGSSHNQAGPELYICAGVAGAPNHVAGVRDAGTIVAINNDPDASIFKSCTYGIVGDLYEVIPALTEAL